MYGDHPRGSNDALFVAQELLGRPTDTTVTVNAAAVKDLEAYYEYGTDPGSYSGRTASIRLPAGEPAQALIGDLEPNSRYHYRMRYREPGAASFEARAERSFHTARPPGSSFTFFIDRYLRLGPITSEQITDRVRLLRSYFDLINHSVPLFLVNGNHEGEWGRHLDGTWGFDEARPGWAMPIHQLSEGGLRPDVPARRSMQS